jgi:nitroreductase
VAGLERQAEGDVLPANGTAILVLQDDSYPESIESCACALMAMALEATSCGLASQFTSWTRGLSFQKDIVAWIGIEKPFKPFTSIIVGNPVTPIAPRSSTSRRSIDEAVRWM